jgi:para-aminobenzoate synthetase/4-amino-4-deoxychorismate lyase
MAMVLALLDDRNASREQRSSRLYTGFVREHRCIDPWLLDATWAGVEADQRAGLHALLLADYEWGAKLLGAGISRLANDDAAALRVLMFERCERLSGDEVSEWLANEEAAEAAAADGDSVAGVVDLVASVDRAEFTAAIARIQRAIVGGETYQVNFTYRLSGRAYGTPLSLYRRLRQRQPVAFGAFIVLPAGGEVTHVLSLSPELFVRQQGGVVTARPMKGTAARFTSPEGDSETARLLAIDTKNRAENLMIVDLLRNDLGRVARIGSVKVPELFAIEPYQTLFQMTSTVQARLRPEVSFPDLLRAIFPCGSITGAPKHHTMDLIADLESTPRGIYCGAIGWVEPPATESGGDASRCGDFCLSVAIRTLTLGPPQRGLRPLRLGIGAGIVIDSRADDEFDECRLKARFLTGMDPGFGLFETLLVNAAGEMPLLNRHLARLGCSAAALGFAFDVQEARRLLLAAAQQMSASPRRFRLALAHDGGLTLMQAGLEALAEGPARLLIASQRLPDFNPLACHKTTLRRHYDQGVREAQDRGGFDSLFFNTSGALVEGGRSSVFLKIDGRWLTPPVDDGALPGVMRSVLLADPAWAASERRLTRADLDRAEALVVCNALRGVMPARLAGDAATGE